LDDVRVLDLSRFLAGPFATAVLADLGADVVRVVRPGEAVDLSRQLTVPGAFEYATARNKRVLELDLGSAAGRDAFLELVVRADIVFDNFRPGTLDRLGLGFDVLEETNPGVIACSITGYGDTGPWAQMPSYDLIAQAASGSIDITGPHDDPEVPPCRWGVPMGDLAAGLFAVIGMLGALAARERDGVGQRLSVSMLNCLLALSTYRVPQVFNAGLSARASQRRGGAGTTPYGAYLCSDSRWLAIGFAQPHWAAACEAMGRPDLVSDPRFDSESARKRHADEVDQVMAEVLRTRPSSEWEAVFIAAGAPAGKVNTIREALEHPQIVARKMVRTVAGETQAVHIAADPMGIGEEYVAPAALSGPDKVDWKPITATSFTPAPPAAPLDGTRIIEMDGNEPSKTLAAQILADLGADVLLIERPTPVRPREADAPEDAFTLTEAFRWGMHRGKRAIKLDLKTEEDRERYYKLVAESDVVYDNYRPGVKARLGVSRDQLTAVSSNLVTCSATGFGAAGPWAHAPAYDVTLQALGGSNSLTGNGIPGEAPVRWGHPIGGLAGALYGTVAVLASLRDVRRGRPSRHIDLSLLDVQIALHTYRVPQTLDLGIEFGPQSRAGGSGARPYGVYRTSDERWYAAGITDQFWTRFCTAIARPELADDPAFATGEARTENADALEEIVEAAFRSKTSLEWDAAFLEWRLPGSRVLTLEEAFRHPQATLSGMLREIPTERGSVCVSGFPIQFSRSPVGHWTPPPDWETPN
jgi:crotonobetainyl-CoA:carnitine CoA-transferase CaiB-like acyl-CoA transferase